MRHPPALVALRAVTDAEYSDYRQRSIPEHAAELTRARRVPTEQALRMTRENIPAGLADRAELLYRSLGYGVDSTQLSKSLEDPR